MNSNVSGEDAVAPPEPAPYGRVLIADDDRFSQRLLHRVLSKWGYEVIPVSNGDLAWELLSSPGGPRLAILDWMMPAANGPEVCARIRASRLPGYTYIILLTSRTDPADLVAGLQSGADDYLTKPYDLNELKLRLSAGRRVLESHERHRLIAETAPDAIVTMNGAHCIQFANTACALIFGYPAADLIGMDFSTLVPDFAGQLWGGSGESHGEHPCAGFRHWPASQIRGKHAKGHLIDLEISCSESRAPELGHLRVAVIRDITARRLLERQLAQAQKLESIGQLAAGIAHEINTPIQYVGDNLQFLTDAYAGLQRLLDSYARLVEQLPAELPSPPALAEITSTADELDVPYLKAEIPAALSQAQHGVEQVATIVRAMKEFAHPGPVEMVPTNLNRTIENAVMVSRNEWKYVADVVAEFDPDLPPVPCVASELNQVLLNLIVNAAHAVAETGKGGQTGKGKIVLRTAVEDQWAKIEVADDGAGIPEAVRPRVFDPFFTTKEVGKGSGQGLAIAYAVIVQKHGGTIQFDTALGQGTTFRIRLPFEPAAHGSSPRPV
jgi:PAS domain S-box-containing protein